MNVTLYCKKCGKEISTGTYTVLPDNSAFHSTCFTCDICSKPLPDKYILLPDGKYMHNECYIESVAQKCIICKLPLGPGQSIVSIGTGSDSTPMHSHCFKCASCSKELNGKYLEKDGKYYDKECFSKEFSPKCVSCQLPIPLDSQFHKLGLDSYHPHCFCCFKCEKFLGGSLFKVLDDHRLQCQSCVLQSSSHVSTNSASVVTKPVSVSNTATASNVGAKVPTQIVLPKPIVEKPKIVNEKPQIPIAKTQSETGDSSKLNRFGIKLKENLPTIPPKLPVETIPISISKPDDQKTVINNFATQTKAGPIDLPRQNSSSVEKLAAKIPPPLDAFPKPPFQFKSDKKDLPLHDKTVKNNPSFIGEKSDSELKKSSNSNEKLIPQNSSIDNNNFIMTPTQSTVSDIPSSFTRRERSSTFGSSNTPSNRTSVVSNGGSSQALLDKLKTQLHDLTGDSSVIASSPTQNLQHFYPASKTPVPAEPSKPTSTSNSLRTSVEIGNGSSFLKSTTKSIAHPEALSKIPVNLLEQSFGGKSKSPPSTLARMKTANSAEIKSLYGSTEQLKDTTSTPKNFSQGSGGVSSALLNAIRSTSLENLNKVDRDAIKDTSVPGFLREKSSSGSSLNGVLAQAARKMSGTMDKETSLQKTLSKNRIAVADTDPEDEDW